MVPQGLICAKSKLDENPKSAAYLLSNENICQKNFRFQPYSRPFLLEELNLFKPAGPPPKERAGRLPAPDINCHTTRKNRLADRKPSCTICESTYNEMSGALDITPCSAAEAVNPDGDHARTCGSLQPGQPNREPQFCSPQLAEFLLQCLKGRQPPLPDGYAAAVSGNLPFSVAQAKAQPLRQRLRRLSADAAGQRRYQQGFAKYSRRKGVNYRKKLLRPQHRTTERLTSPTAAIAKAYFWRCGLTRERHPQAAGATKSAQRPVSAYRALQKVMSVYRRRHPKDNMQC